MKTIAITGVHGSGKTTLLHRVAYVLRDEGYDVATMPEVARECPYDLGTYAAERWIWYNHYADEMEERAAGHGVDFLITDRCLMDHIVYLTYGVESPEWEGMGEDTLSFFTAVTEEFMKNYDVIVRLPLNEERITNDIKDDLRPKDLEYARAIDLLFDKIVHPYVTTVI